MEKISINKKARCPNILLGITGSVAAVKGPEVAMSLKKQLNANVVVLLTSGGENFWDKAEDYNSTIWQQYSNDFRQQDRGLNNNDSLIILPTGEESRHIPEIRAEDEWKGWNKMGDPVLHIQLRDWADICVIAPLSAHTLAKISNGLCDETLSCVLRAWNFGHSTSGLAKPLIVAPAMNTAMWDHPLTRHQLNIVFGFYSKESVNNGIQLEIVEPQVKTLACGEVGAGAMANVEDIVNEVRNALTFLNLTSIKQCG